MDPNRSSEVNGTSSNWDFYYSVDLVTYPILLSIGSVGNVLNMIVLSGPRKHTNIAWNYLLMIACADFIYMFAGLVPHLNMAFGDTSESVSQLSHYTSGFWMFLQESAAFASDWLIVAFTADRLMAIKMPLRHSQGRTARKTRLTIGCVTSMAFLLPVLRLIDYYWFIANDTGFGRPPRRPQWLRWCRKIYAWILVGSPLLTLILILVMNGILAAFVIMKEDFLRQNSTLSAEGRGKRRSRGEKRALKMLASCVLVFTATQIPSCVLNLTGAGLARFAVIFLDVNYSTNFYVYCMASSTFRKELMRTKSLAFIFKFVRVQREGRERWLFKRKGTQSDTIHRRPAICKGNEETDEVAALELFNKVPRNHSL